MRIETERLILRPLTPADAPWLVTLAGAYEVASMTGSMPHPYATVDAEHFIAAQARANGDLALAIAERAAPDALIGCIGLRRMLPDDLELGYWLGVPYWGRGFASEAARVVVAHGFADDRRHRLIAGYFLENPASRRVLEKLGFKPLRPIDHPCIARGHSVPAMLLVLAREWWQNSPGRQDERR